MGRKASRSFLAGPSREKCPSEEFLLRQRVSGEFRTALPYSLYEKLRRTRYAAFYVQIFSSFSTVFTFAKDDETAKFPSRASPRSLRGKRSARSGRRGEGKAGQTHFFFRRYGAPPTYACTPYVRRALELATPNDARWNSTRDDHHALVRTAKRLTNRRGDSVGPREWRERERGREGGGETFPRYGLPG